MADLRELIVDEASFDQAEMTTGLMPYVRLGSEGQLRPGDAWEELSERSKVLAVLLAYKAAATLGLRDKDTGSAIEIAEASGVAHGTVRPVLRQLLDIHIAQQHGRGRYSVQAMRVSLALRLLAAKRDSNGN